MWRRVLHDIGLYIDDLHFSAFPVNSPLNRLSTVCVEVTVVVLPSDSWEEIHRLSDFANLVIPANLPLVVPAKAGIQVGDLFIPTGAGPIGPSWPEVLLSGR
jgi:hypothetical protein